MNIKFDAENKKSIVVAGILIMSMALLFQFVYFPKSRELKRLTTEHKDVGRNIDGLYNFIGGRENLKDNIIEKRKELALLEDAFPSEKEVSNIIKQLNEEARRFEINVHSLKPKNLLIYKDNEGKELKVADYFCKCMPLTLNVEGRYQALGEFLRSLEVNRDPMIIIKEVDIEKDGKIAPRLKAEIDLNAFMLGK